jgi:hypothetical protein
MSLISYIYMSIILPYRLIENEHTPDIVCCWYTKEVILSKYMIPNQLHLISWVCLNITWWDHQNFNTVDQQQNTQSRSNQWISSNSSTTVSFHSAPDNLANMSSDDNFQSIPATSGPRLEAYMNPPGSTMFGG